MTTTDGRIRPTPVSLPDTARLGPADVVRVGLLGVRGRPMRAILSGLGIAIGIAAMVAMLGIGTAGQARLMEQIRSLGTNMLSVGPGDSMFGDKVPLPEDAVDMVRRIGPVTSRQRSRSLVAGRNQTFYCLGGTVQRRPTSRLCHPCDCSDCTNRRLKSQNY
ncbi:ABC transporter permease [Embleya sp. NPDC059237]|uniref:ABC transporter permease n=1 Tax=Embleya sp. NPDC059237 TaxID=3346784 RepID=UPI003674C64F